MQRLRATPGFISAICILLVCGWWFPQVFLVLKNGGLGISTESQRATEVLLLLQLLSISLFLPQWVEDTGAGQPCANTFTHLLANLCTAIIPAWPALGILWLASEIPVTALILAETLALSAGVVIGLVSFGLRLMFLSPQSLQQIRIFLGVILAVSVWFGHEAYFDWLMI